MVAFDLQQTNPGVISEDKVPKAQVCIAFVPAKDHILKATFLEHLEKQNLGINTSTWCVLKVDTDRKGGQTITFTDEEVSVLTFKKGSYIFLSVMQIDVRMKRSAPFIKTQGKLLKANR